MLVIASSWMIGNLANLGHGNAVAVDATFGSNSYGSSLPQPLSLPALTRASVSKEEGYLLGENGPSLSLQLNQELKGQTVLVRGRVHAVRGKGKMAFLVVREAGYTVQCLASVAENVVSKQMLKFISSLNKESIVDVEGKVSVPPGEIAGTSQQLEIQIRKVPYCSL
ncbi:hypothetical protein R1sor_024962 [Riccia sorocarpa]|uniref:Aspartyl-tRNA synthetase n=1 Tax=Riccia sorocarpa TaxID=122646 RepID=A0ABD3G972_9MARC